MTVMGRVNDDEKDMEVKDDITAYVILQTGLEQRIFKRRSWNPIKLYEPRPSNITNTSSSFTSNLYRSSNGIQTMPLHPLIFIILCH